MISGLLQTSEYAREFLHLACGPLSYGQHEDEIDRMVAKRMQRQQVLSQPGKRVHVVMLEGALRARVVSAPTLAGQLDRLLAVIGLLTLELGIIPFEAAVPVVPLNQVAARLGVKPGAVYYCLRAGDLPYRKRATGAVCIPFSTEIEATLRARPAVTRHITQKKVIGGAV